MSKRRIYDVKRVIHVKDDIGKVNEYLSEGWVLLLVYADDREGEYGPAQYPIYVLGYESEDESPPETRERVKGEENFPRLAQTMRERRERRNSPDQTTAG